MKRYHLSLAVSCLFAFGALGLSACGDSSSDLGPNIPMVITKTDSSSSGNLSSGGDMNKSSSSSVVAGVSSSSAIASSSGTEKQKAWDFLNPSINYGEFTDERDGQVYKMVTIGEGEDEQTWMAQNLNYDYNEGTAKSYCYNDNPDLCDKYGRLYMWSAAMDSAGIFSNTGKGCGDYVTCGRIDDSGVDLEAARGVCPEGWHLPSPHEWYVLLYVNGQSDVKRFNTTSGWSGGGNGSDVYGFSALPAGSADFDGSSSLGGTNTYFWSSTENSEKYAYTAYWRDTSDDYQMHQLRKNCNSVRCIKDK